MDAAPSTTCPECGHDAKAPEGLLRTRRRWRLAVLGVVLLTLAGAGSSHPWNALGGWYGVAPTTALLLQYDLMSESQASRVSTPGATPRGEKLVSALRERSARMWAWQRRYLAREVLRHKLSPAWPDQGIAASFLNREIAREIGGARPELRALLDSSDLSIRARGINAAAYAGWHAEWIVPRLRPLALDPARTLDERCAVLTVLRIIGSRDAFSILNEVSDDQTLARGGYLFNERLEFAPSLAGEAPCSALAYSLHRRLQESFQPAGPLGEAPSSKIPIEQFKAAMTEGAADPGKRFRVVMALLTQELRSRESVALLVASLRDPDEMVRYAAAGALGAFEHIRRRDVRIAPDAAQPLAHALNDESALVRATAAWALGLIDPPQTLAIEPLAARLGDQDVLVRRQAALALARMWHGAPGAADTLVPALDDPDPVVRLGAARALVRVPGYHERARKVIEAALRAEDDPAVMRAGLLTVDSLVSRSPGRGIDPPSEAGGAGGSLVPTPKITAALRRQVLVALTQLETSGNAGGMGGDWAGWLRERVTGMTDLPGPGKSP
jgi:hypothetical protein